MKKNIQCFLFFVLMVISISLKAQKKPFEIGFNTDYGFILKHTKGIGHLIKAHPYGLTASFGKLHLGKQAWQQHYNYPKTQYSLTYFDFLNPIVGKTISASANLFIPITKNKQKRSQIEFHIGTGFVYATNPFDIDKNPQNTVLSSRMSYLMRAGIHYQYNITKNLQIKTSLQLTHNSNAARTLPNNGINIISLSVGTAYLFNAENVVYQRQNPTVFEKKWHLQTVLALSPIETFINQGKKDWVVNWGLYLAKDINKMLRMSIGTDISWNEGIKRQIEKKFSLPTDTRPDYRRAGLVVGGELFFGKMSLQTQFGYYFYRPFPSRTDQPFYQRYGLRYYVWEGIYTAILLKTHAAIAESVEFSVGYNFTLKRKTGK